MNHKIFKLLLVAILLFIFVLFVIPSVFNSGGVVAADSCSLQIFEGLGQKSPVTSEKGVQSKVTFLQDASSPVSNESNIKNNLSNYDIQYHKPTEDIIKDSDIELSSNLSNGGYLAKQSPSSYNYSPPNYVPNYEDTIYFSKLTGLGYHTPISPSDLKSPSSTTVYSPAPVSTSIKSDVSISRKSVVESNTNTLSDSPTSTPTSVSPNSTPNSVSPNSTPTSVTYANAPAISPISSAGIQPSNNIPNSQEASSLTAYQMQSQRMLQIQPQLHIPVQLQLQMPVALDQIQTVTF